MKKLMDLPPISDEEEARVQAGIASDPDNPELTDAEMAGMRPAREVLAPELYAALTQSRSRNEHSTTEGQVTTAPAGRNVVPKSPTR